ncbi:MAG: long-chain fatty acid--CoA ligase [Bacteroidales bacterium]|nr:long-chain fatty acid--CoA ligase [Bacteroidales bacterium]
MEIKITRTFDLLDHLVLNFPKDDILAGKSGGEWVKYSSQDYYKFSHFMAYGFIEMGLQPGDRVVTLSQNCPEWNFVDMALSMVGAIHVPVYPTLSTENYLFILQHSGAKCIFVSNNLLLRHIRPALQQMENPPEVYTMNRIEGEKRMLDVLKLGITNRDKYLPVLEERKDNIKPEDWVTLIYTSGTTGMPKGVMLSHRNLMFNAIAHSKVQVMNSSHRVLSFLPLNHVYERSMNYHYQYLGISIYYAESIGTIQQNMHELRCDGFCAVPRVLEMVYDKLYAAGKDFRGAKRWIYQGALRHGSHFDYSRERWGIWYSLTQRLFDKMVYRQWREKFGGRHLTIITGGSSVQERIVRLFSAAGMNVYEGYGMSETSPVIAVNNPRDGYVRIGTVGPALAGTELKIADDGEILTRGPHVMMGYYKDPEYTAEVIDSEGWLHTGDVGKMDGGIYLKITDRKKDIFKLSGGKYVAPQVLENKMCESEYIDQTMVVGANEKFAAAIITPNFNTLHYWALKHRLHYRDNAQLIQMPEVNKKYQQIVEELNKGFAPHEQVKRIKLVEEEWTSQNGMLSPTMKLRRNVLIKKYESLIAEIYERAVPSKTGFLSGLRSIELPTLKLPFGKKEKE